MPNTPLDPLDKKYFTYVSNSDLSAYQIVWFFENQWTSLNDISSRNIISFGNELWALFLTNWINSNKPIQEIYDQNSFTWIDIKNFNWILTNWENIGDLKAIFNNNFDNNIVWTWWVLSTLENSFKNKMQIFMQWTCTNWWKNLNWFLTAAKTPLSPNFSLCEGMSFPINMEIISSECNNWLKESINSNIKAGNTNITFKDINSTILNYEICYWNSFNINNTIFMSYCPIWWEKINDIKLNAWRTLVSYKINESNEIKLFNFCKKIK